MTSAKCTNCNFDNKEIEQFGNVPYIWCRNCGEPFINPIFKIFGDKKLAKVCIDCKLKFNDKNAKFCTYCGEKLKETLV